MAKVRTLIVDDSGFFRRRIRDLLEQDPGIEVVGEAANGREAVTQVARLRPDVVTMDIEMPELDGTSAVREIMRRQPTPILMFSSLTHDGARATLDALDAGAVDFLPKRFSDLSGDSDHARQVLRDKVLAVGRRRALARVRGPGPSPPALSGADAAPPRPAPVRATAPTLPAGRVQLVVIGTSTGGPVALQRVLARLPADFPLPLLLFQHMPQSFTPAFATRLDQLCRIEVREAVEGDTLRPGVALLAPGGCQLGLQRASGRLTVRLFDAGPDQFYKPSVDLGFAAAAEHLAGRVLAVVLTGMGADGCQGAAALKNGGSVVWSQDEASSVIYGMPGAVAKAGLSDQILDLDAIGAALAQLRR